MVESIYRPARPAAVWWNVTKTLVEIFAFWFVFLIALPIGISVVEIELAVQRFPSFPALAALLLAVFTLFGLWAALTVAIAGRGTPLPIDEARRLVTTGPYAYVRNPLSIAFMGQGTAIVLALGSVPVMIYCGVWPLAVFLRAPARGEAFGRALRREVARIQKRRPRVQT